MALKDRIEVKGRQNAGNPGPRFLIDVGSIGSGIDRHSGPHRGNRERVEASRCWRGRLQQSVRSERPELVADGSLWHPQFRSNSRCSQRSTLRDEFEEARPGARDRLATRDVVDLGLENGLLCFEGAKEEGEPVAVVPCSTPRRDL